jgi:hypothetical protein
MYREHLPAHLGMSSDMSAICRVRSGETGERMQFSISYRRMTERRSKADFGAALVYEIWA